MKKKSGEIFLALWDNNDILIYIDILLPNIVLLNKRMARLAFVFNNMLAALFHTDTLSFWENNTTD